MPSGGGNRDAALEDTLVITVRKGFWAAPESEVFPHRLYAPILIGHSTNLLNTTLLAVKTAAALAIRRPRVILFGSAHRIVPIFLLLKRYRLLRRTRLVVTNQVYFGPRLGRYAETVIVYSRREAEGRPNYVYVPLAVDGKAADAAVAHDEGVPYVFSGGGTLRDFESLFAAVEGTGLRLIVVTHSPATLGVEREPPSECRVLWRMPLERFLSYMKGALFVVVPLRGIDSPHGQTTIAQALQLGKPIVATRCPTVLDYVRDGAEGLLVEPGDVQGYRDAMLRLVQDEEFRSSCERAAQARAAELSYAGFASSLVSLCDEAWNAPRTR